MNDQVTGWLCTVIACVFFGSMFVPIKPYDTKDGFFVQWMQTCGILFLGMIVQVIRGFPTFYALSFSAGIIWATGNICTVPIINMIGSSLGYMIWGTVQIVIGWATGRFGWFGLTPEVPYVNWMQYLGVVITILSGLLFILVKPSDEASKTKHQPALQQRQGGDAETAPIAERPKTSSDAVFTKIFAIVLALFAGFMFGESLTPITYVEEQGASPHGLDHAFAFSVGTCVAGTLYFVLYSMFMCNKPFINERAAMPSFFYGLFWAVAQFSWFVASEEMSQAVTFPIITRAPAIIATLWGVLVFREIKGTYNLILLSVAIVVALVGVVLVGLSNAQMFAPS